MKLALIILGICVGLVMGAIVGVLTWQFAENRRLAGANQQLQERLEQSEVETSALESERESLIANVAALQQVESELRDRLTTLETEASAAARVTPRPYRVRAFLGQENVGQAWIIPHNLTRDPESGRYLYEPVLVIDESAKGYFTEHHTNIVEREVYTAEYYDGYRYPSYYYVTPGHPGRPQPPPSRPQPSPAPAPAEPGTRQQPDANARVFAPPMSVVNSRPQVIGTPGTAPVNQRVFAPNP